MGLPTPASGLKSLGPSGGFWAFWKPGRTVPFRNVCLDVHVSCKHLNPEQVPLEGGTGQWEAWGLDCSGLCHGLGGGGAEVPSGPRERQLGAAVLRPFGPGDPSLRETLKSCFLVPRPGASGQQDSRLRPECPGALPPSPRSSGALQVPMALGLLPPPLLHHPEGNWGSGRQWPRRGWAGAPARPGRARPASCSSLGTLARAEAGPFRTQFTASPQMPQ